MVVQYLLSRGYIPSTRLNLQAYLMKESIGYILHPSIPIPEKDWKVADVAAGTGIWISELARNTPYSSVAFDGFDISSEQFPHPSCLPANVTMSVLDAMKPPPEHLCGIYDIVHVRLLLAVVDNNDPTPVLQHCLKLLKPGGYLQWDEMDPAAFQALPHSPDFEAPCLETLCKMWQTLRPIEWIASLPSIFEQNKLTVISADAYPQKPWQRHIQMEAWCLLADEYASMLEGMGMIEKANSAKQLASGAYTEIKKGAIYAHTMRVAVGRTSLKQSSQ